MSSIAAVSKARRIRRFVPIAELPSNSDFRDSTATQMTRQRRPITAVFDDSMPIGRPKLSGKPNVSPARNSLTGRPSTKQRTATSKESLSFTCQMAPTKAE
jgi:hypothetical protein